MTAPKPMSDAELASAREYAEDFSESGAATAAALLADRDYHCARAEAAEDEAAQLLADLADMRRERDEARRERCEQEDGALWTREGYAKHRGWGYLYPEEPSR